MAFEELIAAANRRYELEGRGVIEKQHTPFKPLRPLGAVFVCRPIAPAIVDFMGRFGSLPVAFEAKDCAGSSIALTRVQPHQADFLRRFSAPKRQGVLAFVLVSFGLTEFYAIPWAYWDRATKARAEGTGRASIRAIDLPLAFRARMQGGFLDYLTAALKASQSLEN